MADQAVCKAHNALGNAAVEHQLASKDKEGNGQEREHLHPANHFLEHHRHRQTGGNDGGHRRQANRKRDRHTDD